MTDGPRSQLPAPRIPDLPRVEHGGPNYAELAALGVSTQGLLDFSVNTSPLGTSPRALRALSLVDPASYPDPTCDRLCGALASYHSLATDSVLCGNGSVELIWLLAQAYLAPGDTALVVGPTFGEYEAAAARAGATVVRVDARETDHFRPDPDRIANEVRRARPRLVFLCNPNNPTGQVLGLEDLAAIADALEDGLLVIDEAYVELADGVESAVQLLRADRRVVLLHSLTKMYGLAGLRLGYLLADPVVTETLARAQLPWSVNAYAQAAGVAALADEEHREASRHLARLARARLVDGLERLGLSCIPSRANYGLARVGDGRLVRTELLRRGILVRDCRSFGLPAYVRVAARPLEECERLLNALGRLVSSEVLESSQVV